MCLLPVRTRLVHRLEKITGHSDGLPIIRGTNMLQTKTE
jgi:hypothetical protein